MSHKMRVIALVDMDCFYCQVEEKLNPSLRGKPVAVVQYNLWRDGGIIAANYQAKEKGVTKGMWMHEAINLCPDIEFARVAELRGRADLTKYREAGNQVAAVLSSFVNILERASVDEAYLDLTESVKIELAKGTSNIPLENLKTTHVVGCTTSDFISNITVNQDTDGFCEDDLKLAIGGIIVERIRKTVLEKTGYECSAGIAHNKILAKLVCGLHKPNKQTILPQNSVFQYLARLPLKKIKRLGGKFGKKLQEELKIQYVGELLNFSEKELDNKFDTKMGRWLYNIARGTDHDPVSSKLICKSISCCKRFPGKNALFKYKDIEHWTNELCLEISERLCKDREDNHRIARMITISLIQEINKNDVSSSKTISLKIYDTKKIAHGALEIIRNSCVKSNNWYHVKYLGISAGNFETMNKAKNIKYYLEKGNQVSSGKELISKITVSKIDDQDKLNDQISSKRELVLRNSNNMEKVSYSAKTQDHNSLASKHCVTELKNSVLKFERTSKTLISKISVESVLNEGDMSDNSFFARYFDNFDINTNVADNPSNRNELELSVITQKDGNTYEEDGEFQSSIGEQYTKCEECKQNILITEIIPHRDYHYAMNLHKKESFIKHPISSNNIAEGESNTKIAIKRKVIDPSSPIDVFLRKQELDSSVITETCTECSKKIKLTEWEYHSDYHAAKKLYNELNCKNNSSNCNTNQTIKSPGYDISRYLKRKSS